MEISGGVDAAWRGAIQTGKDFFDSLGGRPAPGLAPPRLRAANPSLCRTYWPSVTSAASAAAWSLFFSASSMRMETNADAEARFFAMPHDTELITVSARFYLQWDNQRATLII